MMTQGEVEMRGLWRLPTLVVCGVAVVMLLVTYFVEGAHLWAGQALGKAGLIDEYCEKNRMGGLLRQPLNSLSNLIYLWVALLLVQCGRRDARQPQSEGNLLQRFPILSGLFGLCAFYLFVGSTLYHASLLAWAQRIDITGTHGVMLTIVGYSWLRLIDRQVRFRSALWPALLFLALVGGGVSYFAWFWRGDDQLPMYFLPLLGFLAIFLYQKQTHHRHPWRCLGLGFGIANLGFLFRTLDVQKILCWPESLWWQGHALWHVLTGVAIVFVYLFFRGEECVSSR